MSTYTVRPISDRMWLRPAAQRKATRFSSKWRETEQLLLDEVGHLDGRDLVIEVDVREQDLKLDGTLRANAREASTPAVVVAFESKHGPMLHRCDTFYAPYTWQGPDWQHNVRVDRPWDARVRLAKAAAHPDRHAGDRTMWDQVEQASRVLGIGDRAG